MNKQQYTQKWLDDMEKDEVQKGSSYVSEKSNNNKESSNILIGNVKSNPSVSTPKKNNKRQTVCFLCKETVSNLARHLRSRKHGIDNPMNIITQNPEYRPSKSKTFRRKRICCFCKKAVLRLPQHLRGTHRLTNNEEILQWSAQAQFADFEQTIDDLHLNTTRGISKVISSSESDEELATDIPVVTQSEKDKDVTQPLLETDSSFRGYPTPLSLLDNFTQHLKTLTGGNLAAPAQKRKDVQEIIGHVGNEIKCLTPHLVEQNYFNPKFEICKGYEGTDGQRLRDMKPSTLKVKLQSFQKFIDYLNLKYPNLRDNRQFQNWNAVFPGWFRTINKENKLWKGDKRETIVQTMVSKEYYQKYLLLPGTQILEKSMKECTISVSNTVILTYGSLENVFLSFRDHLIVVISTTNANRPSAICNFTAYVLKTKQQTEDGGCQFVVGKHKSTATQKPVVITFDKDEATCFEGYLNVRAKLLSTKTNNPDSAYIFCTQIGNQISNTQIRTILTTEYRKTGFSHVVSSNRLRVMAASTMADEAPEKRAALAASMCHLESTRNSFYIFKEQAKASKSSHSTLKQLYKRSQTNAPETLIEAAEINLPTLTGTTSSIDTPDQPGPSQSNRPIITFAPDTETLQTTTPDSNQKEDGDNASENDPEITLHAINADSAGVRRIPWEQRHVDIIMKLFSNFIKSKKSPTLPQIRQVMKDNESTITPIAQEREVNLKNKKDAFKFEHAIDARIKIEIKKLI